MWGWVVDVWMRWDGVTQTLKACHRNVKITSRVRSVYSVV